MHNFSPDRRKSGPAMLIGTPRSRKPHRTGARLRLPTHFAPQGDRLSFTDHRSCTAWSRVTPSRHVPAEVNNDRRGRYGFAALMRPSLRSFIVSSMNSRNRHRVLAQIYLRKKGRRTPAPRAQGTCSSQIDRICTIALHNSYTAIIYEVMLI